jgi:hypothetical protein
MSRRVFLLALLGLCGCLHAAPLRGHTYRLGSAVPEEAPACTSTRTHHDTWLVAGATAGGMAGGGALAVSIETDNATKIATAITSGVLGVAAAVMTAAAGITADSYARECTVSK